MYVCNVYVYVYVCNVYVYVCNVYVYVCNVYVYICYVQPGLYTVALKENKNSSKTLFLIKVSHVKNKS